MFFFMTEFYFQEPFVENRSHVPPKNPCIFRPEGQIQDGRQYQLKK